MVKPDKYLIELFENLLKCIRYLGFQSKYCQVVKTALSVIVSLICFDWGTCIVTIILNDIVLIFNITVAISLFKKSNRHCSARVKNKDYGVFDDSENWDKNWKKPSCSQTNAKITGQCAVPKYI